jgi:hypothetical protein
MREWRLNLLEDGVAAHVQHTLSSVTIFGNRYRCTCVQIALDRTGPFLRQKWLFVRFLNETGCPDCYAQSSVVHTALVQRKSCHKRSQPLTGQEITYGLSEEPFKFRSQFAQFPWVARAKLRRAVQPWSLTLRGASALSSL